MKKVFIIGLVIFSACKTTQVTTANSITGNAVSINGKLFTSMYQQKAAEYRALCFQAFNIAALRLDAFKAQTDKPKAIVTDIDETILDNSPYAVHQAMLGKEYDPTTWYEWTDRSAADTLPGSAAFLKYAASKGVEIFYITNRDERERASTIKNLKLFNLPNADDAHFLPKQTISSKETRRQTINSSYEIVLFLGDNLADFSSLFDKKTMGERYQNTNISVQDFGNRFIVLPNPGYGDWEGALYKGNRSLTQQQKDSVIKSEVKGF